MKKIIYARPDGSVEVFTPAEGARLANFITFPDGSRLPNVVTTSYNVSSVTDNAAPLPVDQILRRWPVAGATADWAETEDEFIERLRPKVVPVDALDVRVVTETEIPADRTFRGAWMLGPNGIEHDMDKAREIQKNRLRELRSPLFEPIERAQRTALANGDLTTAKDMEEQLQALRDVTADPSITTAQTVDELKAALPAVLIKP